MSVHEPHIYETQVLALCEKYHYEEGHCRRVALLAASLFEHLSELHGLGEQEALLLRQAALVHDIGHFVRYQAHHKHTAYLVRNDSALASFPAEERELLAVVAGNHRKRPRKKNGLRSSEQIRISLVLSALLRLADALDRDRRGQAVITDCQITSRTITLSVRGVDLDTLAEVIAEKCSMFKSALDRKVVVIAAELPTQDVADIDPSEQLSSD